MPRYIDANKLIRHLEDEIAGCKVPVGSRAGGKDIAYGTVLGLKMAKSYAETLPGVDVAPRSEVERLKAENERLVDLVRELQEYNEAWVEDNGKLRNENKNLAREIFKEIGKRMVCTNEEDFRVFAELKKKYTGGSE